MAGIWVNSAGQGLSVGAGLLCRAVDPARSGRSPPTRRSRRSASASPMSISAGPAKDDADEETYRSAVIRLKEKQKLFQEHDDGVAFIGRSLFRATVDLPVNVPIGRYTADVYLFRDGKLLSKNQSTLEVQQGRLRARGLPARLQPSVPLRAARGADRRAGGAGRLGRLPPRLAQAARVGRNECSSSAERDAIDLKPSRSVRQEQAAEHGIDVGPAHHPGLEPLAAGRAGRRPRRAR